MGKRRNLIILTAPSSAGKDYTLSALKRECGVKTITMCTTRPMRPGEVDGVDYYFLTEEEFLDMVRNDGFLEYRSYDTLFENKPKTYYYGSPKVELDVEETYALAIDLDGARFVKAHYGEEKCLVVFLECNDLKRLERAKKRSGFDLYEWNRRVEDDSEKFREEKLKDVVDLRVNSEGLSIKEVCFRIIESLEGK